jgi:hypothetical protein
MNLALFFPARLRAGLLHEVLLSSSLGSLLIGVCFALSFAEREMTFGRGETLTVVIVIANRAAFALAISLCALIYTRFTKVTQSFLKSATTGLIWIALVAIFTSLLGLCIDNRWTSYFLWPNSYSRFTIFLEFVLLGGCLSLRLSFLTVHLHLGSPHPMDGSRHIDDSSSAYYPRYWSHL